jgi:hypothetical protein
MSLLAPLFLAGLFALAVPILIHLTQRTKKEPVPFPSLMFLSRVPFKTTRRQQIRNWLLFLLRSAAIVILVIAFARPWLRSDIVGGAGLDRAREVVLMLDRSYSMVHGDRWDRAIEAARHVATGLGPDDRASLVLFSDRAEVAYQPMDDPVALGSAINRARLGSGTTRYGPALRLAEQILEESQLARREAVLISDFQRTGWDPEEDALLPDGARLTTIDVGDHETANNAVTDVVFDRGQRGGRERVSVLARITNFGEEAENGLEVTLELDGQRIESRSVDIEAGGSVAVRFPELTPPQRDVLGTVRIPEDALPLDDVFRFVLAPGQALSVLMLEHPNANAGESLYLERALGIGSDPPHRTERRTSTQFNATHLEGRAVVILNDVSFPRGTAGQLLRQFVLDGGGLFVALGQRSRSGAWPSDFEDLLPGRIGGVVDRLADRGTTLNLTDYDHPLLELFSTPRSGDFSHTRFYRYHRLIQTDAGESDVLARFDDGAVALTEVRAGEGRVVVWTSGLSNSWNDFPVQPVFLPFVHQLTKYLAGYAPDRTWFTAGEVIDLSVYPTATASALPSATGGTRAADRELVVELPSGGRSIQDPGEDTRYLTLDEQGVYRVRFVGDDNSPVGTVAVNVSATESDLATIDPEELASAVTTSTSAERRTSMSATLTPAERERRQGLWWYLLLVVLVVLVAETTISNRIPYRTR